MYFTKDYSEEEFTTTSEKYDSYIKNNKDFFSNERLNIDWKSLHNIYESDDDIDDEIEMMMMMINGRLVQNLTQIRKCE